MVAAKAERVPQDLTCGLHALVDDVLLELDGPTMLRAVVARVTHADGSRVVRAELDIVGGVAANEPRNILAVHGRVNVGSLHHRNDIEAAELLTATAKVKVHEQAQKSRGRRVFLDDSIFELLAQPKLRRLAVAALNLHIDSATILRQHVAVNLQLEIASRIIGLGAVEVLAAERDLFILGHQTSLHGASLELFACDLFVFVLTYAERKQLALTAVMQRVNALLLCQLLVGHVRHLLLDDALHLTQLSDLAEREDRNEHDGGDKNRSRSRREIVVPAIVVQWQRSTTYFQCRGLLHNLLDRAYMSVSRILAHVVSIFVFRHCGVARVVFVSAGL